MQPSVFHRDLSIQRCGTNCYTASISKDQRFGEFVHGGFAAALIAHTALEHARTKLERTKDQHIIAQHVEFISPVNRKEILLRVEEYRVAKTGLMLHVVLSQDDRPKVSGDVTIVEAAANHGVTFDTKYALQPPAIKTDLTKLAQNSDPNWINYHLPYNETSQGLPLSHWNIYFMTSGPVLPRLHDLWFSLSTPNARITTLMLPIIADSYLRMVDNFIAEGSDFSYSSCVKRAQRSVNGSVRQEDLDSATMASWTATQSLNLEIVRQLPAEGVKWIFLRAEGKVIRNGRLVAELMMLDEKGETVAMGQGTDVIVPAQKWVEANRRTKTGAKIMGKI